MNEIKKEPIAFSFSARELPVPALSNRKILAIAASNTAHHLIIFLEDGELSRLDCTTGQLTVLHHISADLVIREGDIQLIISDDNRYCAVTSRVYRIDAYEDSNTGVVLDLSSGQLIKRLDCGDYHMALAPYPVTFFRYKDTTRLIYASEWNKLDIMDISTGEVLSSRDFEQMPEENDDDDIAFVEWSGALIVSPENRRVASVGWVWHPIGVAFSFDAKQWVEKNKWESDQGKSKRSYAIWDYFWDSPLAWIDEKRLCIWGVQPDYPENPPNCAAVFDADTEEQLLVFSGPTIDFFVFDEYLFSGIPDSKGLSIWSVDDGALLHEEHNFQIDLYHRFAKEFVSFKEGGIVVLTRWDSGSPLLDRKLGV